MNKTTPAISNIGVYLSEIGRIAILSKDQQLFHAKRIRSWLDWDGGAEKAPTAVQRLGKKSMDRMVETNLRMVVSIAKKYSNQGVPMEDLIQEGNLGLIAACQKFDPERGYCFSTFSYWWIRQGITRCLANTSRLIRIPCNASELARKLRKAQMDWMAIHGNLPSPEQLAELLDQPLERIRLAIQSTTMQPRSLDALAVEDGSPLLDVLCVEHFSETDELIDRETTMDRLIELIANLPTLERMSIEGVVFERLTHREVAERLELSTTRVGQLYRLGVQRLKGWVEIDTAVPAEKACPQADTGLPISVNRVIMAHGLQRATPESALEQTTNSKERYENVALPA
jgi:RNA polymerase sigma factor (sigma-70 family)